MCRSCWMNNFTCHGHGRMQKRQINWQLCMLWLTVVYKNHSDWLIYALTAELTYILDFALTSVRLHMNVCKCKHLHSWACVVSVGVCRALSICYYWPRHGARKLKETKDGAFTRKLFIQVVIAIGSIFSNGGPWSIQCTSGGLVWLQETLLSIIRGKHFSHDDGSGLFLLFFISKSQ